MNNENPNYFAIIPAKVRYDNDLKANEKLIFGEITALANTKGYCFATNKYFAKLYCVSRETVSRWISHLINKGYLRVQPLYEKEKIKERRLFPVLDLYNKSNNSIDEKINIDKKVNTSIDKKINTPIDENVKDNNTSINNTSINSSSSNTFSKSKNNDFKRILHFYQQNIGVISPFVVEELKQELDDLKKRSTQASDLILLALQKAVETQARNKVRFAFAILDSWQEKNILTLDQAKAEKLEHKHKNSNTVRPANMSSAEWQNKKWDYIDPELGW